MVLFLRFFTSLPLEGGKLQARRLQQVGNAQAKAAGQMKDELQELPVHRFRDSIPEGDRWYPRRSSSNSYPTWIPTV